MGSITKLIAETYSRCFAIVSLVEWWLSLSKHLLSWIHSLIGFLEWMNYCYTLNEFQIVVAWNRNDFFWNGIAQAASRRKAPAGTWQPQPRSRTGEGGDEWVSRGQGSGPSPWWRLWIAVPTLHFLLGRKGWGWDVKEVMTHLQKKATEIANGKPWTVPGKQQALNQCLPDKQGNWNAIAYDNLWGEVLSMECFNQEIGARTISMPSSVTFSNSECSRAYAPPPDGPWKGWVRRAMERMGEKNNVNHSNH